VREGAGKRHVRGDTVPLELRDNASCIKDAPPRPAWKHDRRMLAGLTNTARADASQQVACVLIDLLHQGASADDFARCLADVEALPDECTASRN
jgi:hypothetical protein